jgi:biopolymer transport protein ExbD
MAGSDAGGRRRGAIISGINVTPLCDILLVLLIIFMVASTYIVSQALKVELPKAKTSDGTTEGPATLSLLRDGTVRWNGSPVAEATVGESLRGAVAANPGLELIISADREVMHGRVVEFIDLAKQTGIVKFAINVERSE